MDLIKADSFRFPLKYSCTSFYCQHDMMSLEKRECHLKGDTDLIALKAVRVYGELS